MRRISESQSNERSSGPCSVALAILAFLCSGLGSQTALANDAAFELKDGDRVTFIGSERTEQAIKHNFLEAGLASRWPERNISFRNLGWAGDDPTAVARGYFGGAKEGYRRLLEEIDRQQPTVIFLEYGETADADAIPQFMGAYARLANDLQSRTKRIVIVSPPPAEKHPAPLPDATQQNQLREAVTQQLKSFAAEHQFLFVDLYTPLKEQFAAGAGQLTYDTIRFTPAGYDLLAKTTLQQLGVDAKGSDRPEPSLLEMIQRKNDLFFHRYRPQNETYLRGFRKHEQGQNAKEISEFDPLIQRAEEQIAAYLQGKPVPPDLTMPELAPLAFKPLSPEAQLETFRLANGFEAKLFAAEPMVANPIHMNFDSRGRLWVASSPIYPQLRPGAQPNDSIIILEDTDGDGVADKKTVFAEGLLIPTGVLPDERGGAYVANSTELIHIADTDGDGVGDERHVLLSGFGTEDTHHILHTFRWSPDALLMFNQSIYIHSHLETPYGVERMLGSGVWRFRSPTGRASQVLYGMVNPWGLIFDQWGQSFATDGAGGDGINYAFPGAAYLSAVGYDRILRGMNPGQPKQCGLEILTGRSFPEAWQDVLVTADFRGNRINCFQLSPQGSGYVSKQREDLLTSSDRAFRPVDLKLGPDGALYIADWHDSIINHGEVDFRDPRRDDRHGRIWRIVAKDRPKVQPPQLEKATITELLELLKAPEQWTRQMARVQLSHQPPAEVAPALANWVKGLDSQDPLFEQRRLEALWAGQAIGQIAPEWLQAVLASSEPRARAAGVRALSQGTQETYGLPVDFPVIPLLEKAIVDEHPQVRLEAVNALRAISTAQAAEIAMRALDRDMDQYLDYALELTMRRLQAQWLPGFVQGKFEFQQDPRKILFALRTVDNAAALPPLMALLTSNRIPADQREAALATLSRLIGPAEVNVLLDRALAKPDERQALLNVLLTAAQRRGVMPGGDISGLEQLLSDPVGLRLIGAWKQQSLQPRLIALIEDGKLSSELRQGAIDGLQGLGDQETLSRLAGDSKLPLPLRRQATIALLPLNMKAAATQGVELLIQAGDQQQTGEIDAMLAAFLSAKDGPQQLAKQLQGRQISPALATLALRKADSAGGRAAPLVNSLRAAGGLSKVNKSLSADEMAALLVQVESQGDAQRGEAIYRRKELACLTCHSIGGAGGLVGPDMLSLGASSPADYIVQSLLEPSAKIKEGYHTVSVATADGKVLNGIMVREGSDQLVLRNAENKEISIPTADIDERVNSPTSMMPAELTDKLPRDEFLDLIAFLSSLGKEGPYKVPQNRFVRRWTTADGRELFSRVDGTIPVKDVLPDRTIQFTVDVTTPGKIGFKPNSTLALYLTQGDGDQNLLAEAPVTVLDLPKGQHTFKLSLFVHRRDPISIEIVDVDDNPGRAEVVNR